MNPIEFGRAAGGDALVLYLYRYWQPPRSMDVTVAAWPDDQLFPTEHSTTEIRAMLTSRRRVWFVGYPGSTWLPRPDRLAPLVAGLRHRPVVESQRFGLSGGPDVTLYGPEQ